MKSPSQIILKNGLRIIYLPFSGFSSTIIRLSVPAGSVWDGKKPGLAHAVEHVAGGWIENRVRRNTRSVWASDHILTDFESAVNRRYAYFSFDVHQKNAPEVIHTLSDFLSSFDVSPETFIGEKAAIVSEMREAVDSFSHLLNQDIARAFGDALRPAQPILGDPASVKRITAADIHAFFKKYYRNRGTVLVVAGAVNNEIRDIVKTAFEKLDIGSPPVYKTGKIAMISSSRLRVMKDNSVHAYVTMRYPIAVKSIDDLNHWQGIDFVLQEYLRYVMRTKGTLSYTAETYLEDTWQTPFFEVQFSVSARKVAHAVALWQSALREFGAAFTADEYASLANAYRRELELDKDYPITQAKRFSHAAMLLGNQYLSGVFPVLDGKIPSREAMTKEITKLATSPYLVHIVGPITKKDEKEIRAAI
jgi:predicted Zn-dependent peptidase